MEVTHKDDHVTHAVVGGSEKLDYTIADGGFLMQMLSASLYKDQKLAVIRETLCNADDAHKMVSQTKPFVVTLTTEKLIIRDFGPGIPHDQIGPVYATYGGSTKQGDDGQTGGFGLGCKAPFAYTDNFQVTSFCNGVKTVYRMSKSDSEVGGKPSVVKIVSVPTQETGLEVSINIATARDVAEFISRINEVLANGGMNAVFNGKQARVMPFDKMEKGYLITADRPLANSHSCLFVRYGAVIYPIEDNEAYKFEYREAVSTIHRLTREESHGFFLILQAEPGSLSLTPSREGLTITEKTNETVQALLEKFNKAFNSDYEREANEIFTKAVNDAAEAKDIEALTAPPTKMLLQKKYIERPVDSDGRYYIVNPETLARWSLLHKYPGSQDKQFLLRDMRQRLGILINSEEYKGDRGLLRTLHRAIKGKHIHRLGRQAWEEFRKRVINPVATACKRGKTLDVSRLKLFIPYNGWQEEHSYYRQDRVYLRGAMHTYVDHADRLMVMQRRVIVLTHCAEDAEDKIRWNKGVSDEELAKTPGLKELGVSNDRLFGALVYEVGRAKDKVEEARAVLGNLKGYLFVDLTVHLEYRPPKVRAATTKVKLPGFPTLSGVKVTIDSTSGTQLYDWQLMSVTTGRVEKPIGFVELYGKSHFKGRDHLCGIPTAEQAKLLEQAYGDRVAVVMTDAQKNALRKIGVVSEHVWVAKQIIKDLSEPSLLAALPGTLRVLHRWLGEQEVDVDFVRMVMRTPELCDALKLPQLVHLSGDQSQVMRLLKGFRPLFETLANSEIVKKIDAMEPPAKLQKFVKGLASNKMLPLIDTAAVRVVFDGDDAELKAKAIKLIKQVLKG